MNNNINIINIIQELFFFYKLNKDIINILLTFKLLLE